MSGPSMITPMYLLFVDESGTHGASPAFVLGGLAIHESDAPKLQARLEHLVGIVVPKGRGDEFELHASEMRNAKKPGRGQASTWTEIPRQKRLDMLNDAYAELVDFQPSDARLPLILFAVVLDSRFQAGKTQSERERFAYEVLLNKFDVMLKRISSTSDLKNYGLVIHDRRVVERDVQAWTAGWRVAAGAIGRLNNFADVPLFSDSRASRLIQAADLVSYAVFRRYSSSSTDSAATFNRLWPLFDVVNGVVHGCVHYTPDFGQGSCDCEPCGMRLRSEAAQMALPHHELARPSRRMRGS